LRWTRRRVTSIHASLTTLKGLAPEHFLACEPTVASFRCHLEVDPVLPALREIAAVHLSYLPPPLGFRPPRAPGGEPFSGHQHRAGPGRVRMWRGGLRSSLSVAAPQSPSPVYLQDDPRADSFQSA
jgi:hypothetical protein